jgi:hypothetical protein
MIFDTAANWNQAFCLFEYVLFLEKMFYAADLDRKK